MLAPGPGTRLIALLGDPVAHSLSPRFQNAAFRAAGLDGIYLALRTSAQDLGGLLRGIACAGGAGNVTVPHKRSAATALDRATAAVHRTGACNTFWLENGQVTGDNTDVAGFQAAVASLLEGEPSGACVLVVGAGGAAAAAVAGLCDSGAAAVHVANRTAAAADDLVSRFRGESTHVTALSRLPSAGRVAEYDLIINATSLGLAEDDRLPLPTSEIRQESFVPDLVYRPGGTRLVRDLLERGITAADGTEMLLQQGAASFARWWEVPVPVSIMRAALIG